MIVAIDTDVLVNWAIEGAPRHAECRAWLTANVGSGGRIAITPQVLYEFVHVVTDPRRFDPPMSMTEAIAVGRRLWDGAETQRVVPGASVVHRTFDLLALHGLGRKRVLDTGLAAALAEAGLTRIATLNGRDFVGLGLLEVVDPGAARASRHR